MTQHNHDEVERLREEVAERLARIEQIEAPMTTDQAVALAAEDPDEFNAKWEAAKLAGIDPIKDDE